MRAIAGFMIRSFKHLLPESYHLDTSNIQRYLIFEITASISCSPLNNESFSNIRLI